MARFNYLQTKIAIALVKGEKGIPGIGRLVGETDATVERELKEMEKLGLAEKKGDFYSLKPEIVKEVRRRKELEEQDFFKVRLKAFVEAQALSKWEVEKLLAELKEKMEKDPDYKIYNIEEGAPAKQEDYYSGFIEVNFSAKDFNAIIKFVLVFGPSTVEVVKPRKVEFTAFELQEGLMDLTDWAYKYNAFIKRHMKREQIEGFNKTLFQQKKK